MTQSNSKKKKTWLNRL